MLSGFMRFFFAPSDTKRYKFEASTGTVVTSVKGTDFTIGYDPDTNTSAVFVTQDSVDVTPTNQSLKPLTLASGNQVEVTANQVGPVTPLSGAAPTPTTRPAKSSSGTSLALIAAIVVGLLVLGALGVLLLVYLRRRARRVEVAPPPTSPAPTGVTGTSAPTQETAPVDGSITATQPMAAAGSWTPTHRAPEGGMACWATPDVTGPVVATLDAGLDVQVLERQAQLAHVVCSNGWSAWVDARLLTNGAEQR